MSVAVSPPATAAAKAANAASSRPAPPPALPADLIPRVCHYLPLEALVLFAATSRLHRRVICRARPAASAANCWLFATLRLQSGTKQSDRTASRDTLRLEVNGRRLGALNAAMLRDVESATFTAELEAVHVFAQSTASMATSEQPQQGNEAAAQAASNSSSHALSPSPSSSSSSFLTASPLLPSLAAFLRSLRYVQRVELEQMVESFNVLLTVLHALPSFLSLHHLGLQLHFSPWSGQQLSEEERELSSTSQSVVVNAVFGCLARLSSLSSLQLKIPQPMVRRHPVHRAGARDGQLAHDTLSSLLGDRLLHAHVSARLLMDQIRHVIQAMDASGQQHSAALSQLQQQRPSGSDAVNWKLRDDGSLSAQCSQLQSLQLSEGSGNMRQILQAFPSLLLLSCPAGLQQFGDSHDSWESSSVGLRFLRVSAYIRGLPEMASISRYTFLHSLQLFVGLQISGTEGIAPLSALGALTQLRELSLEVAGGSQRRGVHELAAHELFDLSWLNGLQQLRYLHIKAFQHTNVETLQHLCLLPADVQPQGAAPPPPPPLFISRVEEFGLDVFDQKVGLSRAAEFRFDAWKRLRRCACRYISLEIGITSFHADTQYVSSQCEEANAVLRQRVGAERWVTEEQLIDTRYDQRWKAQMAARL